MSVCFFRYFSVLCSTVFDPLWPIFANLMTWQMLKQNRTATARRSRISISLDQNIPAYEVGSQVSRLHKASTQCMGSGGLAEHVKTRKNMCSLLLHSTICAAVHVFASVPVLVMLIFVLVLKDSLRTKFKSLSLSLSLPVQSLTSPIP